MTQIKTLNKISLARDTTFKYLYKSAKGRKWLDELFYMKTLIDLSDYKLIDNEINTGNDVRDYRMDIILEKDNDIVILEMNTSKEVSKLYKNYSYLFRIAGSRYKKDEKYSKKITKLITLNSYSLNIKDESMVLFFPLRDEEYGITRDMISSYEIYLPKQDKICYDKIEKRLQLFYLEDTNEMRKITDDPEDLEIINELEKLMMNEDFIYMYDHEEEERKIRNSIKEDSFEDGVEYGIIQGNLKNAKAMLNEKIDIEVISKVTGLTKEEIEKINN